MRRFLDWTAAQTGGQLPAKGSHQGQSQTHLPSNEPPLNPARELELQHLTKLLHEIKYYQASSSPLPSAASSQNQREFVDKVHRTLPLFLNIFGAKIMSNQQHSISLHSIGTTCPTPTDQHANESNLRIDSISASKPSSPSALQGSIQMDRFPDLLPFAFTIARLFVSEVRQRASNKHAEEASLTILKFLSPTSASLDRSCSEQVVDSPSEAIDHGWSLLLSLNTLALSQSSQIIQLLCDASLPSTLIKCLYLFFDLPSEPSESEPIVDKESSEEAHQTNDNTPNYRGIASSHFVKAFTQLLVQLCSHQVAIDELIKKDDLRLLIGIASSQRSSHNKPWRKAAFQTLTAISKNMKDSFTYLEQNKSIQVFVENLHRINSLGLSSTEDFVDMIRILVEFLYNLDVNNRTPPRLISPLIEQAKSSRITDLIEELILKIDDTIMSSQIQSPIVDEGSDPLGCPVSKQPSVSSEAGVCVDEYRRYGRRLIQSLTYMAKINMNPDTMSNLSSLKPLTTSRFEMLEQFKMPRPSARDCVLNTEALRLMKMAWSKCRDYFMIEAVLDATISLFNDDKYNYFIFESHQLLVYYMTSYNFNQFPFRVKQKLFKFLEFIIIETNYIPCLELGTLGTIINKDASSEINRILVLKTLIACLRFNQRFSDIFREIGLLEVIVELSIETMQKDDLSQNNPDKLEVLYLLLEASQYLLAGPNNLNCIQFNESGAARHVFNCLSKPKFFQLFVPAHSSSSDDGGPGLTSRTNTPTPTLHSKFKNMTSALHQHSHWTESTINKAQNKPSIKQMQKVAFTIIRQLILSSAGDEHLANLLGLLARNFDDLKNLALADKLYTDAGDGQAGSNDSNRPQTSKLDYTFLLTQEVNLKICILKSLMIILKDSHRCRALFRKVGGFIYIVSSLVVLEKALPLCEPPNETTIMIHNNWSKVNSRRIWRLIKNSLMTIVVAMRSEPANVRAFSDEVLSKFSNAIRRLGCFRIDQVSLKSYGGSLEGSMRVLDSYRSIFLAPPTRDFSTIANDAMRSDDACCQLLRFLYDMSLDMSDGTTELELQLDKQMSLHKPAFKNHHGQDAKSISFDQDNASERSSVFTRRSQMHRVSLRPPSLDLKNSAVDKVMLSFPCIVISMLDLIPSCPSENLIIFMCMVIKSLLKHERNQQLLCDAGMISKLLDINWRLSVTDRNHYLYSFSEFMLEKLTSQSITAKELRMFLRLGEPLRCKNLSDIEVTESFDETRQKLIEQSSREQPFSSTPAIGKSKEKISADIIESLVAMLGEKSRKQPPFIEFDMSSEGCSSIFMPSIAPVNARSLPPNSSAFLNSTLDVHTNEKNGILGGVGPVERQFPPLTGLTFSSWVCIENFPLRSSDSSHNLRLLTIYRGSAATGKEFSCFKVQISALDRALIISTQETLLFDNESNRSDAQIDPDCHLRVWTPELLVEGKWHHIAISMNRSLSKPSNIHVYVDGNLVHHQKICYISSSVGATNSGPLGNPNTTSTTGSAAAFVNAFIGALPQFRLHLRTRWKQGPCHLIEEQLNANFIAIIHALGPDFAGNFQTSNKLSDSIKMKCSNQITLTEMTSQKLDATNQKPLIHQQSAAIMQSPRIGAPLARVSSSTGPPGSHAQSGPMHYCIPEDKILMNVDARATSYMTLSRMRRIYTRFDCRQVSRVLGVALNENSTPILLFHNTSVHLNGPSRGVGAITVGYNRVRFFVPSPTEQTLYHIGGCYILIGFIAQTQTEESFIISLKALVCALKCNPKLQAQMNNINGYQILSVLLWKKKQLLSTRALELINSIIVGNNISDSSSCEPKRLVIQQVGALRELICESFDLWLQTGMINLALEFIYELISSTGHESKNSLAAKKDASGGWRGRNLKCLRDMDLLPRMLRLLLEQNMRQQQQAESNTLNTNVSIATQNFDAKAVYLIKQTVFELLNRTPRQSDILYFGQFLASLLPSNRQELNEETIGLRNILLKSLLQMMTKNKQKEINCAMQEELVRILGFDWFMLFISASYLDPETITVGLLNLLIVLSNDELYGNFKSKNCPNGGWLKEPTFSTMDNNSNIQMLGINVGVFFGLGGRRKSMKQDVLEAPNFYLLISCLTNLVKMPRIYLMIFLTMTNRLTKIESSVMDMIETFDKMNLDILCDCLIGDTHHKRRQTLSTIKLKCHELVVCIVYMLHDIMCHYEETNQNQGHKPIEGEKSSGEKSQDFVDYPIDIIRFFMYLYNNNQEFQNFCRRSDDLIDVLCETLMQPAQRKKANMKNNDSSIEARPMTNHPASKEILELSRLIILDKMTEVAPNNEAGTMEQLHAFERFLDSMNSSREAQGELVDALLRQVLLMIDSTARHNSIKTIGGSENILQFQLLLINSISISQIVTDKLWTLELFQDNYNRVLTMIDHQLALAEQIFKFNELLPRHNPPHAFIMQRVLNRIILYALSRPLQHISDKMTMLDLLKKIYDNRTIIILNHMHSPQSAEFFVCFTYCLMKIIEDNSMPSSRSSTLQSGADQPTSLIERQFGNPVTSRESLSLNEPSSSALMLVSMARKVWDAIYQSKKGILSEAFDVSLSLPAFTLDTSLDLLQLKSDINEVCEKYWSNLIEAEQKPRRRLPQRQNEPTPASSAVNILSGRLTRVVNAASFVSRVVGATAGTMASNVNLVGEKLAQNRTVKRDSSVRSSIDSTSGSPTTVSGQTIVQSQSSHPSGSQGASTDQMELFKHPNMNRDQVEDAIRVHISIIEDYIKSQLSHKNHKLALHKYLCDEWYDIEVEILLRERAIFGPDYGSKLDKWCLDMTEGPRRMRKKMINNTSQFYSNYPYLPEQFNPSNKSLRYRPPMSYDSHLYYLKTLSLDDRLLDLDQSYNQTKFSKSSTDECRVEEIVMKDDAMTASLEVTPILVRPSNLPSTPESNQSESLPTNEDRLAAKSPVINIDSPQDADTITGLRPSQSSRGEHQSSIESLASPSINRPSPSSPRPSDCDPDDGDSTSFVDFSPEIEAETNSARESENIDSLSVLRLLEKNERISHMFRCSRVQGLDTYEGLLLFGREHFYLIDGFTLLKTREIKDIDSLPPDAHDPIIPNSTPNLLSHSKKTCAKFSFDSIVEVHKRRYLLQPIALEVFSSDGRNTLIVFPRNIRNKVHSRLMTVSTQLNSNTNESLAGQKSNVSVEGGSGLLSNLIGETSVTQRWVRGELSNFQYLMNLNTIAGRSYNDLMQYPIFPWILADYSSDKLDLTKASTFRDLSRPVGAQTSERLEQFKRRYAEWDDTETPPYHYGTFYSSAMIVASYMVRMEPFTQHFLRLQGGHFDLADRMFHSIQDSWLSASKHNMADIKELIPEFFYLPEFLRNDNKYDLGIKQNGMRLDNVILPPWAKDDAREFIRMHRCALESDYVSAHLHEWIDLIFGYKQQGQAAVDAVNVFHHLFYEGNVDIYNTDIDPIKKNAVIGFINNFGQVPKQLFKKPHPVRKVMTSTNYASSPGSMPLTPMLPSLSASSSTNINQRALTLCPQALRQVPSTIKDLRGPVGQIVQIDKNVVAVEQNKLLIPPEYCRYVAWGHADRSLRLSLYDSEKPVYVWEGSDFMFPCEVLCCTIPNSRIMITAGTESLITVWKIDKMKSFSPITNLYGHVEPVTCLASSQSYSLIVSGSRDRTAIIWDLNRFTFVRQLGGGPPNSLVHHGPISAIDINDSTGDIATCASSWLYLWSINGDLLAQVDSFAITMQQSMCGAASSLSSNLSQLHILSVCFSQLNEWDSNEVIVTGTSDGSVAIWSLRHYQAPMTEAEVAEDEARRASLAAILEKFAATTTSPTSEQPEVTLETDSDKKSEEATNTTPEPVDDVPTKSKNPNTPSEPITIRSSRQRTDTMNSEWVRLSSSSTSTVETIPNMMPTPTSMGDQSNGMPSGEFAYSFSGDCPLSLCSSTPIKLRTTETGQPLCSAPSPSSMNDINASMSTMTVGNSSLGDLSQQCDEVAGQSMSKNNLLLTPSDPTIMKFSKSDTSLVDSFVLLGDTSAGCLTNQQINSLNKATLNTSGDRVRPQSSAGTSLSSKPSNNLPGSQTRAKRRLTNTKDHENRFNPRTEIKLQPNYKWKRELYLRTLLPRRGGKIAPSPVTSLAISKDHKTLYVGESSGRISCWSTA